MTHDGRYFYNLSKSVHVTVLYFVKFKNLMCNFCSVYHFFLFLSQFSTDFNRNYI